MKILQIGGYSRGSSPEIGDPNSGSDEWVTTEDDSGSECGVGRRVGPVARKAYTDDTSGLAGLGPEATREGDVLCVLYGADIPFIIRQKKAGYALVGECYVRKLMRGRAVEGTIPGFTKPLVESWIDLI
jgi:hypothetical protein